MFCCVICKTAVVLRETTQLALQIAVRDECLATVIHELLRKQRLVGIALGHPGHAWHPIVDKLQMML